MSGDHTTTLVSPHFSILSGIRPYRQASIQPSGLPSWVWSGYTQTSASALGITTTQTHDQYHKIQYWHFFFWLRPHLSRLGSVLHKCPWPTGEAYLGLEPQRGDCLTFTDNYHRQLSALPTFYYYGHKMINTAYILWDREFLICGYQPASF